jgi:hypothetical protein
VLACVTSAPTLTPEVITKYTELPPVEVLREHFNYNPETGEVTWAKCCSNAAPIGKAVRSITSAGYISVSINKKCYQLHRVIWKLYYGEEPHGKVIDHINRNKTDNRINNLRLVTWGVNCLNRKLQCNNKSGAVGVYKDVDEKYQVEYRNKYIGRFNTFEEAVEARQRAEAQNEEVR